MVTAVLVLALVGPPTAARAAAGTITTTAQGLRVNINLLLGLLPLSLPLPNPARTWTTGNATSTASTLATTLPNPLGGAPILTVGAVTATAAPVTGGGKAEAGTAGLGLLGSTLGADAISTSCAMTASTITTTTNIANLTVAGLPVNPTVGGPVGVSGVLSGTIDKRVAAYNSSTGRLDYTVRALDLDLLGGLAIIAGGKIIVAESTCSGIVKLGAVTPTAAQIVPGTLGTPKVTVTNTGDVAAPGTTIRIPAPPTGYTLGTPTVTGGGTCTTSTTFITCTGVTVPGQGNAVVSLPTTVAANAAGAADWAPAASAISAVSTPIPGVTGTTISADGGGTLVTVLPPVSHGGSFTVTPMTLAAGKAATTTVTVANQGPSDATGTVTISLAGKPAGISIVSATSGGTPCSVNASAITCSGVTVPGGGSTPISIRAAATTTTPPGTTFDLTSLTATLNGTAITGSGRLLTVSDPDVNLDAGVTITPATAVPGGSAATATVGVRNIGVIPATGTVITLPAPPAGYTVGTVTTTGGGTCTTTGEIRCTGVTVPAMSTVTVTVPVTLGAPVTAGWSATAGDPVTATSGDSTGTATGTIVTADPQWTLGVTSTGPAARTVRPGQTATLTVTVADNGPSDARDATYVVVAPTGTTFDTLSGAAGACTQLSPTTLRCTQTIPAAGPPVVLTLPLIVSAQADPATPLADGCVSRDNDLDCADAGDVALASIQLRTPLASRLTTATAAATIVPGQSGTARVRLTSTQDENGLVVTVPTGALPAGFTLTTATVPGGACTVGPSTVRCTGVDLTHGVTEEIALGVPVASSVTPPATWTATGIVVDDGAEQVTVDGALAGAGTPASTLTATVTGPADNTVQPGDTTTETVVVRNTGPSDAPAAAITVIAPAGTTFGAPSGTTATQCVVAGDGGSAVCTVTLTAGTSSSPLVLPVIVPGNASAFTPIGGGCVDLDNSGTCGGAPDVAMDPILLRVPFNQRVSVTSAPATVTPGDDATATVTVHADHGAVTGLTVTVPLNALPAGVTVTGAASAGAACVVNGTTDVTCTGVDLAGGGTADIALDVAATAGTAPGGSWTAMGIIVSDGVDQITADRALATVGPAGYVLDTTVTPPAGPLEPGDTGTLGVQVDNLGPSDAAGVPLGVIAPTGATFGPLTGATAADCVLAPDTIHVTCGFSLTAAGAPLAYSFDLLIDPGADPGVVIDGGCVDLDNDGVCGPGDDPLPDIWLATPLSQRLTLGTDPATIVPGEDGLGLITLESVRPETGLSVTVPITSPPAGFSAASATVPGGTCVVNANDITCTGVDLAANTRKDISVRVLVGPAVAQGQTWTVTNVDVSDGTDHVLVTGPLAAAGTPRDAVTATVTGPADGTVAAGDTTSLTVVASNAGPSDAIGRSFTISAPAGTVFGTLTGAAAASCTGSGTTLISCTVNLPAAASTAPLVLPLVIDAGADPFVALTGGCVDLDGGAGCTGPADETVDPIVLKVPYDRRARIDTAAATVTPGTEDTATVGITALHGALSNLTLTVPLTGVPGGLTVTSADASCATTATQIRCTGLGVADQATQTITLRVRAGAAVVQGVTWTATGITVTDGAEQITADRQLALTGPPVHPLDAVVTQPAAAPLPGGTGTLGVTVHNRGPSDHPVALIGVIAPTGTTIGPLTAPTSTVCSANPARTRLNCGLDLPAAGPDVQLAVPIVVPANADPGQPPTGGCVDLDNDSACTGAPTDEPFPPFAVATPFAQQLTVTTTPATVAPGETGVARVVVTTDPAQTGLTIVVPLAGKPGDVFAGAPSVAPNGTCVNDGTEIRCTGVDIPAGTAATVTVPVSVTASAATNLTWTATGITVRNAGGDTATGNGLIMQTGPAAFRLTATTAGPAADTVLPGGTAPVTVTLDNTGPSDATGAPVTLHAPSGTTFGPLDGTLAQSCAVTSTTLLTCAVTLAADDQPLVWTLPVVVPGTADPQVALTGGCADLDGDGACGGNADVALPDIHLRAPLAAVLTVSGGNTPITPGDTGTATITVAASQARTGLTIAFGTAGLPTGLSATAATAGGTTCTLASGTFQCTGVNVTAGGQATVTVTMSAAPDAPQGGSWTPVVTITQSGETDSSTPQLVTVDAPVHPLTVTVAVPAPGTLLPGGTGDLTVTVTNAGPSRYTGARVNFKAPNGTTFGPLGTPPAPDCTLSSPTLVACTLDLAAESRTFTLPILVPGTADPTVDLTGGCADRNLDGACTSPPDATIPAIDLATPLGDEAQVSIETGTAVPGGPATTGHVVVDADRSLTGLTVTVPRTGLPAGFTVTGVTGPSGSSCTLTPAIVCTGVNVTSGQRRVVTVTVTAAADLGPDVSWNAGPVTLTNAGGESTQATGVLVSTGTPATQVTYTTTGPAAGAVEPGGTATLTVTVRNTGPSDATGVTTSILAPADTTFGDLTGSALANCRPAGPTRLDCTFGLAANGSPLVWSVPVLIPADADPAVVVTGGCLDRAGDGSCAGDDALPGITLRRTLAQALTLSAVAPELTPGRSGTATVTIASADARTGLTVSIPTAGLPTGVTVTSATTGGTACTIAAGAITCGPLGVTAGGSTGITLALRAAAGAPPSTWTPAIAVAQAAATVTRAVSVATVGAPSSAVTVTVVPPTAGTVLPGDTADLAVTVTNAGPSHAVARRLSFRAPTGTTFEAPAAGYCALASVTQIDCTVSVNAGTSLPFTLRVTVPASADPGTPLGGACVDTDDNGTCETAVPAITLGTPLGGRVQLAVTTATVTPGQTATSRIRTTTTDAVTGVTVTVPLATLPAGLTVTGASGPTGSTCTLATTQITCTGVTLPSGPSNAVSLTVRAAANLAAGVTWTATGITLATATEDITGGGVLVTTGTPLAGVTFTVTGSADTTVAAGDITTLTTVVTNPGPSDATGLLATVTAPAQTSFGPLSGRAAADCTPTSATVLTCTINQAAGGTAIPWAVPLIIADSARNGDVIPGACVTIAAVSRCAAAMTVTLIAAERGIAETGTLTVSAATVTAGSSGSGTITISATVDLEAVTLTIPLDALPNGFTVTGATAGAADCTRNTTTIVCAGIALTAGAPVTVTVDADVDASVTSGTKWVLGEVTLVNDNDSTDRLVGAGTLITTAATGSSISVTVGTPSVPRPAPGQTTILPVTVSNAGPEDADDYTATFILPAGTTHGSLPSGCVEGGSARIVQCELTLAAGDRTTLAIPLVVGADTEVGTTVGGGCFDGDGDGACGGTGDAALPGFTVNAPVVDLTIDYSNPRPKVTLGKAILLKLPYSNNGSQSASDVTFTIDPPDGVTVTKAAILLDATGADITTAATAAQTIDVSCEPAPDVDDNAVTCTGPDTPIGATSELWITLAVAKTAAAGTYPVTVMISTTSPEGDTVNNTATAQLTIARADSTDDGDDGENNGPGDNGDGNNGDNGDNGSGGDGTDGGGPLPTTGQDLTGLLLLSVLLVIGGVAARIAARNRKPGAR